MLSEALFFVSFLVLLPTIFMSAFAGALAYEWLQYMPPYAVYNTYFGNFSIVTGGLALGLFAFKEKKEKPAAGGLMTIFGLYIVWCLITQMTSIVPEVGMAAQFDRAWKMFAIVFVLAFMMRSRARIEAFLWILTFSIGNFVLSGAVKTVLTGGGGETVIGSAGNILGERVSFAIAVCTLIPLVRFLRDYAKLINRTKNVIRLFDLFTLACLFTIMGTQARTGMVSLVVLGVFYFFRSKRKLVYLMVVPIVVGIVAAVAPAGYFDRMKTISANPQDASSVGRLMSWEWGWNFALQHPITGGGFHSFFLHKFPDPNGFAFLEAHNIFVETLADHGFPGLFLFLALMIGNYLNCQKIRKKVRHEPELEWAANLSAMVQLAEVTFLVGSMFISDAIQSMPYELVAISVGLRGVVERQLAGVRKSVIQENPVTQRMLAAGCKKALPAYLQNRPTQPARAA